MWVVLIGLYVFVTRVGVVLVTASATLSPEVRFGGVGGAPLRILLECIPLALAALLVFRPDRIVAVINRE